jgi:hypothetical protein
MGVASTRAKAKDKKTQKYQKLIVFTHKKEVFVHMFMQEVYNKKVVKLLLKLRNQVTAIMVDEAEDGDNSKGDKILSDYLMNMMYYIFHIGTIARLFINDDVYVIVIE